MSEVNRGWKRVGGDTGSNKELSFFVSNIPEGVSSTVLWKVFKEFGKMSDAYVARKRDLGGNHFGFIRYKGVREVQELLGELNKVKIAEAKVSVTVARFHKNRTRVDIGDARGKPETRGHYNVGIRNNIQRPATVVNGTSYKDAALKSTHLDKSSVRKVLNVDRQSSEFPSYCVGRAVLGTAKCLESLCKTRMMLSEAGYFDAAVSYVGGLAVMIIFKNNVQAQEFLSSKAVYWGKILEMAMLWKGQDIPFERIATLKVLGVPWMIRDAEVYDSIGSLFGKLAGPSEFSWGKLDNSIGVCYILTSNGGRIEEDMQVTWKGNKYPVWVSELKESWSPVFEGEENGSSLGSNKKPAGSVSKNVDLEEGEIGEKSPVEWVAGTGTPIDEPDRRVLTERTPVAGKKSFRVPMHGEATPACTKDQVNSNLGGTRLSQAAVTGPTTDNFQTGNFDTLCVGPDVGMGRNTITGSRKRPRRVRSPSSSTPDLGGANVSNQMGIGSPISRFPDLNNMETLSCSTEAPEQPTMEVPLPAIIPNHIVDGEIDGVESEVAATVRVGMEIGTDLGNYMDQVRNVVRDEGGLNGNQ